MQKKKYWFTPLILLKVAVVQFISKVMYFIGPEKGNHKGSQKMALSASVRFDWNFTLRINFKPSLRLLRYKYQTTATSMNQLHSG